MGWHLALSAIAQGEPVGSPCNLHHVRDMLDFNVRPKIRLQQSSPASRHKVKGLEGQDQPDARRNSSTIRRQARNLTPLRGGM